MFTYCRQFVQNIWNMDMLLSSKTKIHLSQQTEVSTMQPSVGGFLTNLLINGTLYWCLHACHSHCHQCTPLPLCRQHSTSVRERMKVSGEMKWKPTCAHAVKFHVHPTVFTHCLSFNVTSFVGVYLFVIRVTTIATYLLVTVEDGDIVNMQEV